MSGSIVFLFQNVFQTSDAVDQWKDPFLVTFSSESAQCTSTLVPDASCHMSGTEDEEGLSRIRD